MAYKLGFFYLLGGAATAAWTAYLWQHGKPQFSTGMDAYADVGVTILAWPYAALVNSGILKGAVKPS